MHGIGFVILEVFVTLGAVLVFIRVLLMVLHDLFSVEGHVAVFVGALDAPNWLQRGGHLDFVRRGLGGG